MAGMPHLVKMDKELSDKGLRIIGVHTQEATEKVLKKVIAAKKIKFPVTTKVEGPVRVEFIPHTLVFDIDGKLVFSGESSENVEKIDKVIVKELKRVRKTKD